MHPLDLQYLIRCLWIFFSFVIAFQLIGILAARVNNGKYLQKDISNVPLKFEDASPIICIQEKGFSVIFFAITILLVLVLVSMGGAKLTTPVGIKQTVYFISLLAASSLVLLILLAYRHCFSILTKDSLYTNNLRTIFRTVRIPIEHITKYKTSITPGRGIFKPYQVKICTRSRQFIIVPITNWKCFMDAIDKLKAQQIQRDSP